MSIKLMSEVWGCDLSHPQQSVLLALADHANDDGEDVFPSVGLVAWKTGYSSRQVQRIIQQLLKMELLALVAEASRHESNEYVIKLRLAKRKAPFKARHPVTPQLVRGDKSATTRGDKSSLPYKEESSVRESSSEYALTLYKFYPKHEAPRRADKMIKAALGRLQDGEAGKKLTLAEAYEFLLERVTRFAEHHRKSATPSRFIPHPSSWFNGGSYLVTLPLQVSDETTTTEEQRTTPATNPAEEMRRQLRRRS